MSVKKYGIYLAYPPTINLQGQGLGHHLAEFLKAAQDRKDICFVIACPSWMRSSLIELFKDANIKQEYFEVLAPCRKPAPLLIYEQLTSSKIALKGKALVTNNLQNLEKSTASLRTKLERWEAKKRKNKSSLRLRIAGLFFFLINQYLFKFFFRLLTDYSFMTNPKDDMIVCMLYMKMRSREVKLMNKLINLRSDVEAWYCPTAFWPEFHEIQAPRLMCVPDVVMVNCPISFARVSNRRLLDNFRQIEKSIAGSEYCVTYSEDVKWNTLVKHYHMDPDNISVVPHGVKSIKNHINFSGDFSRNEDFLIKFCNTTMKIIMSRSTNALNYYLFGNDSNIKFIFYASQFRPNKNIISLLKAYDYLLKRQYINHKLILTGDPQVLPEINDFIKRHNLENEVLCLHGLSTRELTACYKLADLAVNPSLSEGGCPFTLTEALSVDTPVVMARIPVTLEVIRDPDLDKEMLFDPYDWKDMADRIEWALQNKEALLAKQKLLYSVLEKRTWRTVVDEYINILDKISHKDLMITHPLPKKMSRKKALKKDAA